MGSERRGRAVQGRLEVNLWVPENAVVCADQA